MPKYWLISDRNNGGTGTAPGPGVGRWKKHGPLNGTDWPEDEATNLDHA